MSSSLSVWSRIDHNLKWIPLSGKQGPHWHQIIRRVVTDLDTQQVVLTREIDASKDKKHYMTPVPKGTHRFQTDLWFCPQEKICPTECLAVHQQRQLKGAAEATPKDILSGWEALLSG